MLRYRRRVKAEYQILEHLHLVHLGIAVVGYSSKVRMLLLVGMSLSARKVWYGS